jgi:L-aspartate-alpha-decarboxylase
MLLTLLKGKIHRAAVTQCDLNYEGSISVDASLLERSGILPHEQVDVLNINNGMRFTTYAIPAPAGSGTIGINGAPPASPRKAILSSLSRMPAWKRPKPRAFRPASCWWTQTTARWRPICASWKPETQTCPLA